MSIKRLDQIVVDRGLTTSRTKAQDLINADQVTVNDKVINKVSTKFLDDDQLIVAILHEDRDVGRGAKKLRPVAELFVEKIRNCRALDIGASTGGFTQVLLEFGAAHVVAVDVGREQLDQRLKTDDRVLSLEGMHIQDFAAYMTEQKMPKVSVITIDVSFISVLKIIPLLSQFFGDRCLLFLLYKPQFELGQENLRKGIVTLSESRVEEFFSNFLRSVQQHFINEGRKCQTLFRETCQLKGRHGNQEYFAVVEVE